MGYRPPKGVRPPQLEGKRTGRPKGSRTHSAAWADVSWGFEHRDEDRVWPPSPAALLWWYFSHHYPDQLEEFLERYGHL